MLVIKNNTFLLLTFSVITALFFLRAQNVIAVTKTRPVFSEIPNLPSLSKTLVSKKIRNDQSIISVQQINPFGSHLKNVLPADITANTICEKIKNKVQYRLNHDPDLSDLMHFKLPANPSGCLSADEQFIFIANQEAQYIMGAHSPWYHEIQKSVNNKAEMACKETENYQDNIIDDHRYNICVNQRKKELLSSYQNRYYRESTLYIKQRQSLAKKLIVQCKEAFWIKQDLFPKNMHFPAALYDKYINNLPDWMLEDDKIHDLWLQRQGMIHIADILRIILGSACPGDMTMWATIDK